MVIITFITFLALFVIIGLSAAQKKQTNAEDYLVASRQVNPFFMAVSMMATNNSGFMFIGAMGFIYSFGVSALWLFVGWIIGDVISWSFVHKRIRECSEKQESVTYGQVISNFYGQNHKLVRKITAILTVLFLGVYAAAQFAAGSKALYSLFGWNQSIGAVVVAVAVLAYCWAGGIRASVWTDVAQFAVMCVSMVLLLVIGLGETSGFSGLYNSLQTANPDLVNFNSSQMIYGAGFFTLGWVFAGFSTIAQPHIMVRVMLLDDLKNFNKARFYYLFTFSTFLLITFVVGLLARVLVPEIGGVDPELALPMFAQKFLPEVFVGLTLAGIFAATISTADSQVLSCASALSEDLFPQSKKNRYWAAKFSTMVSVVIILAIALSGSQSVMSLVLIGWAALAASFGPLILYYALGQKTKEWIAIAAIAVGLAAMLAWRHYGLNEGIYEAGPGMLAGLATLFILKPFSAKK